MTSNSMMDAKEERVGLLLILQNLLELIRFSHTLFALPFALLASVLAWQTTSMDGWSQTFRWRDLAGIIFCMLFARSAAMAFNRLADQAYDADNPRTASRHLPSGKLTRSTVWIFTIANAIGFVSATGLFLPNALPLILSVPVLLLIGGYSYAKRFTWMSQVWLGLSLAMAPIAAWIAIRGEQVIQSPVTLMPPLVLGLAVLFWVAGFDSIYACQDYDFDRKAKLHSIPARFGIARALQIAAVFHIVMWIALALLPVVAWTVGMNLKLGWIYGVGVVLLGLLLLYEHRLVSPRDLGKVNLAFFQVNVIVSLGLFLLVLIDTVWF